MLLSMGIRLLYDLLNDIEIVREYFQQLEKLNLLNNHKLQKGDYSTAICQENKSSACGPPYVLFFFMVWSGIGFFPVGDPTVACLIRPFCQCFNFVWVIKLGCFFFKALVGSGHKRGC